MARIAGVELPNKRAEIALTYLYGVGRSKSREILGKLQIDVSTRINEIPENKISQLRTLLEKEYVVEGDLRSTVTSSIKRLVEINCYRGVRHRAGLPVNGQRTKTNARTRKGRGKAIANKKIAR